ncbi:MAG: hypothetical protein C7B45_05690 [Sulfobacillus acidophilus]|uniref:Uncharacterized protein n=1 Tax=Sulfobacillus acidophilus TaxID=53633 RepID=A0A2T2WKD5_9FIRM|nr:MAG: hypothetical protein C7B45_05690 [Sulfobacillus acidophilus]
MKRLLWTVAALLGLAASLLIMLGMFWVLEIAPLLLFVGMAVAYSMLSRSSKVSSSSDTISLQNGSRKS